MSATRRSPRPDLLPPSPWLRVRRVALIRREIREYVPATTVQLLLQGAEFVIEGAPELGRAGTPGRAYATLMVTIDLRRSEAAYRERPDFSTAHRVAGLLAGHPVLHERLELRLRDHLAGLLGRAPGAVRVGLEFTVCARGSSILIDADACGELDSKVGSSCP